jgi:hypothetical protein
MDWQESTDQKQPIWKLLYDYVDYYGIPDVSPDGMYALSEKLLNDEETAINYTWNIWRQWGPKPTSCDEICRHELYCSTSTTEEAQNEDCRKDKVNIINSFMDIMMNILTDPWIKEQK